MATITRTVTYRCSDDCKPSGCPKHRGKLEWQSTSDAYRFTMNGRVIDVERGELDAMLTLLGSLNRVDAARPIVSIANTPTDAAQERDDAAV